MAAPPTATARSETDGRTWGIHPVERTASGGVAPGSGARVNAEPGLPAGGVADHTRWTRYDNHSSGYTDWGLVATPTDSTVT